MHSHLSSPYLNVRVTLVDAAGILWMSLQSPACMHFQVRRKLGLVAITTLIGHQATGYSLRQTSGEHQLQSESRLRFIAGVNIEARSFLAVWLRLALPHDSLCVCCLHQLVSTAMQNIPLVACSSLQETHIDIFAELESGRRW
jgi:hypothetical protein